MLSLICNIINYSKANFIKSILLLLFYSMVHKIRLKFMKIYFFLFDNSLFPFIHLNLTMLVMTNY